MRTRATGQSPGGFHVLPSPKRVRRQPLPVKMSRAPAAALESSEDEITKTVSQSNNPQKKSATNLQRTSHSTKSRSMSTITNDHAKNVAARSPKSTGSKRQISGIKKTQNNRSLSKKKTYSKPEDSGNINVEVQEIQQSRQQSKNSQSAQSILGKRHRSASLGFSESATVKSTPENPKRVRLSKDESSQVVQATGEPSRNRSSSPFDGKHLETRQNHAAGLRNSHPSLNNQGKADKEASPNSVKSTRPLKTYSTPLSASSRKPGTSKVNPDSTENLETHLRRGMQSIMSRMNKYQYQPLPKIMQVHQIVENSSNGDQSHESEPLNQTNKQLQVKKSEKDQTAQDTRQKDTKLLHTITPETISKKLFTSDVKPQLPSGVKNASAQEEVTDQNLAFGVPKLIVPKNRAIKVENLFRSSAPDATYQNILRAVAERVMRDSSESPTQDKSVAFLKIPEDSDGAITLRSAKNDLYSPIVGENLSKVKRYIQGNASSSNEIEKVVEKNRALRSAQARNRTVKKSRTEQVASTRHVAFYAADEGKIRNSSPQNTTKPSSKNSAVVPSRIEPPTPITQQSIKPPASQGWSLFSAVKNIVASPFKVLGLGFSDNEENMKNVTKNINFEFKPPVTPTPAERRRVKINGVATQHRPRRKLPTEFSARNLTVPQTDRPVRRRKIGSDAPARFISTEKQKDQSLQQKKFQESRTPKPGVIDSTDRRRKKPIKRLVPNPSPEGLSDHNSTNSNSQIEEWPKNLDPNRPVIDLMRAAGRLPRGPNGEDVAKMLCNGWLISKHHDSFIREVVEPKMANSRVKKLADTTSYSPNLSQELRPSPATKTKDNENSSKDRTINILPGRSYGLDYDDDTSSDDEKISCTTTSIKSTESNTIVREDIHMNLSENNHQITSNTPHNKSDSFADKTKPLTTTQALTRTVQKLPISFGTPYTPRMPSNLRNVEAISPYMSQLTPLSSHSNVISTPNDSNTALIRVDTYHSPLPDLGYDFSKLIEKDMLLINYDPKITSDIADLSNDNFPLVNYSALNCEQDNWEIV